MKKNRETTGETRLISYGRLVFEAIPEIVSFQIFSSLVLGVLAWAVRWLITFVAESGGAALTTANLRDLLLSWRGPVILVLGAVLVAVFAVLEIFASLHLYDDILRGRNVRLRSEVGRGFVSLRRFANPFGLLILLYIFIAVPLCGIGFSISLTEGFYIPNFIMEVVRTNKLFNTAYWVVIAALAAVGLGGIFTLHGVVIDGRKPLQAFKDSFRLWKENWKNFVPVMLLTLVVIVALIAGFAMLNDFWMQKLEAKGAMFPAGHVVDYRAVFDGTGTDLDGEMMVYRSLCALVVLGGSFLTYLLTLIGGSYLMLRLTRCYLEYTRDDLVKWPSRSQRRGYLAKLVLLILILILIFVFAVVVGIAFDDIFHSDEPVRVVAHRTGGVMAPENSIEGLELAIDHHCYAAETDTQRTKDGYYIINHDDDFKRLTGVKKKPGDMTLEERRTLFRTRIDLPPDWEVDANGMLLPRCYIDLDEVYKLFQSPRRYLSYLFVRKKDIIEQDTQCARPFLEIRADKQLRADANAESQRLFHLPITKLSEPDRLHIASLLWQDRRTLSRKQLARATHLSPALVEAVFH